jgi:hypothetical protein
MEHAPLSRRGFLQLSALSIGGFSLHGSSPVQPAGGAHVVLVVPPDDRPASAPQVEWAIGELRQTLIDRGVVVRQVESIEKAPASDLRIIVAGHEEPTAGPILKMAGASALRGPESLALVPSTHEGKPILLACGHDPRGLMYAVLELAERVQYADKPLRALSMAKPTLEQPLNAVRAIGRPFVSDVEDKPWFNDRGFWPAYFGMLARQRFNRFHLALGFGYDTLRTVVDAYLLFAYPFLLSVPGYKVRALNLPDAERDHNLEMLRFISHEAAAHGLDFQLGLWTHGYTWDDSPNANYTIEELTPRNQAAYSRDALAALLQECPDITGVTLRTHYESGVHEGSYAFWKTIFEGVPRSGRKLEIELHTKGLDQKMIDAALSTGMPVRLSAKYWAEHLGLPYHQTAIRELELPHTDVSPDSFSALSTGSRNHTRYGYADFLQEGRPYGVMYRVFPGTHKVLLWGDPVTAAAYARVFQFCGSDGAELLEPLSFKGRRGSGLTGGRSAYADSSLSPRRDWEKYLYTYLVWGRLLYNPDAHPDTWRRFLRTEYGSDTPAVEAALGSATRILPIITTAHLPSAAQDTYSPEFYTNQSIPDATARSPYGDTPAPRVFGNVSPLDPQLFSTIDECASQLLTGEHSGKYSPIEVAQWIEDLADAAASKLAEAGRHAAGQPGQRLRRAVIDIRMQIGIGRFFAAKLRSGALYAIHEKSGDRGALEDALKLYRQARDFWSGFAEEARTVYVADITFGPLPHQRGHWLDRLSAIDADIAAMERQLKEVRPRTLQTERVRAAIAQVLGRPRRPAPVCRHTPPASFVPGKPLEVALAVQEPASPTSVRIHYRHVNQAERHQMAEMQPENETWRVAIPANYTGSRFPLQYYFELKQGPDKGWLYPGFTPDLTSEPYFVVRQQGRVTSSASPSSWTSPCRRSRPSR